MQKTTFIYALIDLRDGQVKYIGKSNNPLKRLTLHYYDKNPNKKLNWILHLQTLGLKPELLILDEVPFEKWKWWESFYYQLMLTWGYELKNDEDPEFGGGGSYHTKETREKIKQIFKGKTLEERYGSVEKVKQVKAKSSATKRGKSKEEQDEITKKRLETIKKYPENKLAANKKLSELRKGIALPENHKRNIGEGIRNSEKFKKAVERRNYAGEKNPKYRGTVYQYSKDKTMLINEWPSLCEISGYENNANISSVCNGKIKSAYGYFWSREKLY